LPRALAPGVLHSVYQPIFAAASGAVMAHEALMRPHGEPASPLDVLDEAGRAGCLGEVETLAARVAAAQYDRACTGLLFINLSSHAILQGEIRPRQVLDCLLESGLDLRRIVIELTERDIVEDAARLAEALAYLRARGVRVALDDFGNGHSNFELWHELAAEFVKLDRFLIDGIAGSAGRLAIVKALVEVAVALGGELIAEGIERPADLALVKDLGIPYVQGYLLGRPSLDLPANRRRWPAPCAYACPSARIRRGSRARGRSRRRTC
jgi:EAL domain-containing protein (putative c-di-GMP-specific phosphodiesterase class I)